MQQIQRFVATLIAITAFMIANATESKLYFKDGEPQITSVNLNTTGAFDETANFTISTPSAKVECRGHDGLFVRNQIISLTYDLRWQYKIENEAWTDIPNTRKQKTWESGTSCPKGWSGSLDYTDDWTEPVINASTCTFDITTTKYKEKPYITVYFRFSWDMELRVEGNNNRTLTGTSEVSSKCIKTLYRCVGGNIDLMSSPESTIPKISDNVYGIYDTEDYKKSHYVRLNSTSNFVGLLDRAVYVDENETELKNGGTIVNIFPYPTPRIKVYDFEEKNGKLNEEEYYFKLRYKVNDNITCFSKDSVTFRHFDQVLLGKPKTFEPTKYICATGNANSAITLNGVSVTNISEQKLSDYGIEYKWDYSLDGANWIEVESNSYISFKGSNLNVTSKFISSLGENDVIYFRPKAYLNTFDINVYAASDIVYEVYPYATPSASNIQVSLTNSKVCANYEFEETEGFITLQKKYSSDIFNPNISYTILPSAERVESIDASKKELAKWKITDKLTSSTVYSINIEDSECRSNSVNLEASIKVEDVETNPEEEITLDGCSYKFEDGKLYIQAKKGATIKFGKNSHNYQYNLLEDDTKRQIPVSLTASASLNEKSYRLQKLNGGVNSLGCAGEEIPVIIDIVEDIQGNNISFADKTTVKEQTFYLCNGDKNPKIIGSENITGGYGEQQIIWKVKYASGGSSVQIPNSENEFYSLSAGVFQITEDCEIQRVIKRGNGTFESVSNTLKIKLYSAPEFNITKDGNLPLPLVDVCYEETPIFDIAYKSEEPKMESRLAETTYRIATYKDVNGMKTKVDTLISGASKYNDWAFVYPATITATVNFCNTSVAASNSIKLNVKDDLTFGDKDFTYSCPILGNELEINSNIDDESEYSYKIGSTTFKSNVVKLPAVADGKLDGAKYVNATITRTLAECSKKQSIKIKNVLEPLGEKKLFVTESLDPSKSLVCESTEYHITDNEAEEENVRYSWSAKTTGASIKNNTSKDAVVSLLNGNEIYRTRTLGNNCEVKKDEIAIDILPKSTAVPVISATASELCYGEELGISVAPIDGYKITSWEKTTEGKTNKLSNSYSFTELVKTSGDVEYAVTMANEKCPNYVIANKKSIQVAPNLKFENKDITIYPTDINKSLFSATTKTVTVKLTDTKDLGQSSVSFSFNGSKYNESFISGGEWSSSFSIVESDLEEGLFTGNVFRTYQLSKTKTCVSDTFPIYITPNNGFDAIAINTVGDNLKAGNVFYFCNKGKLQLENPVIRFNDKDMTEGYNLQWYKMTSSGVWYSIKGKIEDELEITTTGLENISEFYKLEVSVTNGGKVYKQSSNVIEVRNVSAPNVNILLADGDLSFCYAGKSDITLQTNNLSNPDGVGETKNIYTWQNSLDGTKWNNIVATTIPNELNVAIEKKNDISTLNYIQNSMTKATYFRVVLSDLCGAKSTSNIIVTSPYKELDLTAKDVVVLSNSLVQNKDSFEVKFFANYSDERFKYSYYNEDNDLITTTPNDLQSFKYNSVLGNSHKNFDFGFGKHKVSVEKIMSETGCKSNKLDVEYEIIAPLQIEVQDGITNACPNNDKQKGYINLVYMDGGLAENKTTATWYYRFENEEYFKKLDSSAPFEYTLKENDDADITDGRLSNINKLDRTCYFYAEIHNEGYPIKAVKTSVVKMEIHPNFKIQPATCNKPIYCYGEKVILSAGMVDTAYGNITYRWIDENDTDKHYAQTETLVLDALTEQTSFKRIATDGCGTTDEFTVDLTVRDKLEMESDEYIYATYTEKGKVPYIAIKDLTKVNSYVLSHIAQNGISDKTELKTQGNEILSFTSMPAVSYDLEKFEIYKTDGYGCISVSDTFAITGIEKITAGTLVFENYGDTKTINICNGEKIGRVIDERIASGGSDIAFNWYYGEVDSDDLDDIRDNNGLPIRTSTFNADTTNFGKVVAQNVGRGNKIKKSFLYRTASINVIEPDGKLTLNIKYSDTLFINVAPTLSSCNIENLAGTIKAQESAYCGGAERSGAIVLTTEEGVEERYAMKNFGALIFGEDYELYGYWETSKGNQKNFVQATDATSYEEGLTSKYYIRDLDTTTFVRFTISDGCSTESTPAVALTVIGFEEDKAENYSITYKYIEHGDNIKVTNFDTNENEWYSNRNEKSLIGTNYFITLDSVTNATHLFHKRVKEVKNTICTEPNYFEIALDVHPVSHGGRIASSQQICVGDEFKDIKNYEGAFGGTDMFRYGWEITTDTADAFSWIKIENAYDDSLNYVSFRKKLANGKTNFIRRSANPIYNDEVISKENYTRYSNVIALETYKLLQTTDLEWSEPAKNAFCSNEIIPFIKTVSPTGGSAEYRKTRYNLDWMYSVDGTTWTTYQQTNISFGSEAEFNTQAMVYTFFEEKKRNQDVTFKVKAVFTDKECGEIESNVFSFKVWAETEMPELYIGADSCDSKYISFIVENDSNYYYNWTIGTDSINPVKTDFKEQYRMEFERHPAYIVEDGYSVQGMHKISGCKTPTKYFNVDSLPALHQNEIPSQQDIICYGSDLTIEHSAATGGTGSKSYLWQYSYDNEKWNNANTGKDFFYEDVRSDMYVRRLAFTDICKDTITSESVLYKVADKVNAIDVIIEENLCKNQDMVVSLSDTLKSNFNIAVYGIDGDTKLTEINLENQTGKIKGNENEYNDFIVITWDSTYTCQSDVIKKRIYARPGMNDILHSISSDEETVCEGSSIVISSINDYSKSESLKERFESSTDGMSWSLAKDNSSYNEKTSLTVNETTYFRSVLFNGCKDSVISNTIKVTSKPSIANPIELVVETKADGTVDLAGSNIDEASPLSLIVNDSTELSFKEKIFLGSDVEKIVLQSRKGYASIYPDMQCYSPITIKPLKDGKIFTECKSTGKQIVGENVTNVTEDATYEWYKYDSHSDMFFFTDITDKNLSLTEDEEGSRMFRKTISSKGNITYILNSNVITINANGPVLTKISPLEKDSLIGMNLKVSDYYVQLNMGMPATLSCYIDETSTGEWQTSADGVNWSMAQKFDSTRLAEQHLLIEPTESVYYRIVATNSCGTTTGDSIYVSMSAIEPITEGCIEVSIDDCAGTAKVRCYDDENKHLYGTYAYSFVVGGTYTDITDVNENGVEITGIRGEVDVTIKKTHIASGVSTTYIKRIDLSDNVNATFSLLVDGVEYASSDITESWLADVTATSSVELASGTKIQLSNRSANGTSFKWEVYYDGIKMATSTVESPLLYVYNEGLYSFNLTAFSGKCESKAEWKNGVTVLNGTLRSLTVEDYEDDFIVENDFKKKSKTMIDPVVYVYPTHFDKELYLFCKGRYDYVLYNTLGVAVLSGQGNENTTITTENMTPGCYTIVVNGKERKLIK